MSGRYEDETLRVLGEELRLRIGPELRAEAEALERSAAIGYRRARSLVDVLADARARGDRVVVSLAGRTLVGTVIHVGSDLTTIEVADGRADVWLGAPLALHTEAVPTAAGRGPADGVPATFRARLLELELAEARCEVVSPVLGEIGPARIATVARDHLVLRHHGAQRVVSLSGVHAVIERV